MEDILGFRYRPLMPIRIGMRPVPDPCKMRHLMQWNSLTTWQPMSVAPIRNLVGRAERQHHRAVFVHIVPSSAGRDCEMNATILKTDRHAIGNRAGKRCDR